MHFHFWPQNRVEDFFFQNHFFVEEQFGEGKGGGRNLNLLRMRMENFMVTIFWFRAGWEKTTTMELPTIQRGTCLQRENYDAFFRRFLVVIVVILVHVCLPRQTKVK